MSSPEIIKNSLCRCISEFVSNPQNCLAQNCLSDPKRDFKRHRKLPLEKMIYAILHFGNETLSNELLDISQFSVDLPTVSAFVQQRKKLLSTAFESIFHSFTKRTRQTQLYKGIKFNLRATCRNAKTKKTTMCFLKRNLQNTCAGYNLWAENRFETIAFKHTRDYFDSLDGELYQVGYCRNEKGQEIDIVVQENATDLQYIEAKHRNTSVMSTAFIGRMKRRRKDGCSTTFCTLIRITRGSKDRMPASRIVRSFCMSGKNGW